MSTTKRIVEGRETRLEPEMQNKAGTEKTS